MKYTVVFLAQPKGGHTAVVPAVPGCVSEGDSVEEPTKMALDAAALLLDSAREHGENVTNESTEATLVGVIDLATGDFTASGVTASPSFCRTNDAALPRRLKGWAGRVSAHAAASGGSSFAAASPVSGSSGTSKYDCKASREVCANVYPSSCSSRSVLTSHGQRM